MPELVDTSRALEAAVERLRDCSAVALDTETDAFYAYRPRICLIQISVPGADLLVDPLADLDLGPLGALLADEERQVVLHAAENDVILLRHEYGWRFGNLYDTQVACFVLGLQPYSLAGILEARFDVILDKGQQRSDWSRRPLTDDQIAYAADDTRHLLELAEDLQQRAREAGRSEEIEWECRRIAERDWEPEPFDPDSYRRLPGARQLDPVAQRALRDLVVARDREAKRRNRAPYRVAPDSALVAAARWTGTGKPREVSDSVWRRHGRAWSRIAEKARAAGPLPARRRPRNNSGEPQPPEVKRRYERLRRWRTRAAEQRGVETWVVARNELLQRIARAGCRTLEQLRDELEPFRFREYGEAILAALLACDRNDPDNGGF